MSVERVKNSLASPQGLYVILIITFAFNLSSHTFAFWPGDSWWLRSLYWVFYLLMALSFILGIYHLLEKWKPNASKHLLFIGAVTLSWLPFALAISMVDIATGRPATSYAIRELQNTGFMPALFTSMVVHILPKHLIFGLLVYLLRFYVHVGHKELQRDEIEKTVVSEKEAADAIDCMQAGFMRKLSPHLRGQPQLLQAQEHYLKVTTSLGQELILYKLGQAMREIPEDFGLQVHRSYWVAKENIRGWIVTDKSMSLVLYYGGEVSVSRRFQHYIKQHFSKIAP